MKTEFLLIGWISMALLSSVNAQDMSRRATFMGGGGGDFGKCTAEVVIDGAVEIEIRGDTAVMRNLQGQLPQWRRFQCTGPLPANPGDFRFSGVDGRGRQQLVRDPRGNGGVAVVRLEDPSNGSEGYTFDIQWGGGGGGGFQGGPGPGRGNDRGPGRRFTADEAVRACQDAVREQAGGRFNQRNVEFLRTNIDDNPGRNDWVVGALAVRRMDRREIYRFSCSVNFDSGRVRSAQIEQVAERDDRGGFGGDRRGGPGGSERAMENCRRGVEDRLRNDGFGRVEFRSINVDNRPGRNDWIVGNVKAEGRGRADFFEFSCSVDMRDGDIRSVDVRRPR